MRFHRVAYFIGWVFGTIGTVEAIGRGHTTLVEVGCFATGAFWIAVAIYERGKP